MKFSKCNVSSGSKLSEYPLGQWLEGRMSKDLYMVIEYKGRKLILDTDSNKAHDAELGTLGYSLYKAELYRPVNIKVCEVVDD